MHHVQMSQPTHILQSIAGRVLASRRITRNDQQLLMSLIAYGLSETDNILINKIHDGLRCGIVRVVD